MLLLFWFLENYGNWNECNSDLSIKVLSCLVTEIISVDSLLPKFEWIDIDEWNFSSEPPAARKRVVHLREKFPVENKQRQSTTSFYSDSAPELRGQRESKMSSVGSIKSNESLSGFGSAHKDEWNVGLRQCAVEWTKCCVMSCSRVPRVDAGQFVLWETTMVVFLANPGVGVNRYGVKV